MAELCAKRDWLLLVDVYKRQLVSMVQPLLIILVLSLILAAVLANRLSKGIIRPILDLDLEHPEECNTCLLYTSRCV